VRIPFVALAWPGIAEAIVICKDGNDPRRRIYCTRIVGYTIPSSGIGGSNHFGIVPSCASTSSTALAKIVP